LFIRKNFSRPIVFVVEGADDYDTWEIIYNSIKPLNAYIIVTTAHKEHAETCYNSMNNKDKNVVLVEAKWLDLRGAISYLQNRIYKERINDDEKNRLAPFSEEALMVLYEKGEKAEDKTILHSIGWLQKTFKSVIDKHLDDLLKQAEKNRIAAADELSPESLIITADKIRSVRKSMNQGN
jgi:hypothetical protein